MKESTSYDLLEDSEFILNKVVGILADAHELLLQLLLVHNFHSAVLLLVLVKAEFDLCECSSTDTVIVLLAYLPNSFSTTY